MRPSPNYSTTSRRNPDPMLRYKRLLDKALDPDAERPVTLRDLARAIGLPIPTLHSYVVDGVLPRIDNANKMASYFGESVSSLFSEDDDLTAALVQRVRALPEERKRRLLEELS